MARTVDDRYSMPDRDHPSRQQQSSIPWEAVSGPGALFRKSCRGASRQFRGKFRGIAAELSAEIPRQIRGNSAANPRKSREKGSPYELQPSGTLLFYVLVRVHGSEPRPRKTTYLKIVFLIDMLLNFWKKVFAFMCAKSFSDLGICLLVASYLVNLLKYMSCFYLHWPDIGDEPFSLLESISNASQVLICILLRRC